MRSRPPIDRFSEEQTARVVRGSDAPDIEAGVSAIRPVLKTLPTRPGVYRMPDVRGDVLYVGKARALKHRVAHYVQIAPLPQRQLGSAPRGDKVCQSVEISVVAGYIKKQKTTTT